MTKPKMPVKKTKKYKNKMKGPVHRKVKTWFGMKAFYSNGNIKTDYLNKGKKRAQKLFDKEPTSAHRKLLRQFTEALNFRSKYRVSGTS